MATKKKQVLFYNLSEIHSQPVGSIFPTSISNTIEYIKNKAKVNRRFNINADKLCLIESAAYNQGENSFEILFKSARHSFRPNLINRNTTVERANPKLIEEGEIEKVHLIVKIRTTDVTIYMEKNRDGVTINNFVDYLNHFMRRRRTEQNLNEDFHYSAEMIVRDDFLQALNSLRRVSVAEVFYDKALLGGRFFNLSNRTFNVKQDVILTLQSDWGESIKEAAIDAFNKFNAQTDNAIRRIRVHGKNDSNGEVILNTDFIEKRETVDLEYNTTTGEINTQVAFRHLRAISNL